MPDVADGVNEDSFPFADLEAVADEDAEAFQAIKEANRRGGQEKEIAQGGASLARDWDAEAARAGFDGIALGAARGEHSVLLSVTADEKQDFGDFAERGRGGPFRR